MASLTRVLSLIQERQPSMSFIMLADIPAFSASFSCVSPAFSRCFLMFNERVFRRVWVLSLILVYGTCLFWVVTPDISSVGLDISDSFRYIINIPIDTEKAVRVRCFTVLFLVFSCRGVWIIWQFMVKNKKESKAQGR